MSKIIYLNSHPIQYLSPLLKQLSNAVQLRVGYLSKAGLGTIKDKGFGEVITWDEPLLEGYASFFIPNLRGSTPMDNGFLDAINPGVFKVLLSSPEKIIVLNGWSYLTNWLVFIFGPILGKEIWLRAESPLNQELRKSKKVLFVKKILLKHFLFKFLVKRFLYIGSQNKAFYNYYGVDDNRLIFTPYAVDNEKFRAKYNSNLPVLKDLRASLKIPTNLKIILFSGKYITKKRPLDLLHAFENLASEGYGLIFLGDGMLRSEMESYVSSRKLKNVWLTGFVNQSQIDKYYSIADVFVMTSGVGETWGLSVNEAMNFSLPVIVSTTCGSSFDLVEEGENGYTYTEGDIEALTKAIRYVFDEHKKCERMGNRSFEIVQGFSIEKLVTNISKTVNKLN